MFEIMEAFPKLSEIDAAAIAHEFEQWWNSGSESLASDDRPGALIGFAAGWIRRPVSDFSH
jgi:hypothetical protein